MASIPEVVLIAGASAGGVSSLIAGDIQFLAGGGGGVISAALNGADVIMVAPSSTRACNVCWREASSAVRRSTR